MSDQQQAEATQHERPHRRGRFWLALILLTVVCGFAVYRSDLFRLAAVEVTGANRLTEARVMEIAGLARGVPRWEHPARAVEERLQQEPWVRAVHAAWVGNRLKIALEEREAAGLLRYGDLFYLALDDSGIILEQVDLKGAPGMPVVSGVVITKAVRGQQLQHQGLLDALTVLSRMAQPLRQQVSEVQVENDRALTLFMTGGATVQFGLVPDLERERVPSVEQKIKLFGDYWRSVRGKKTGACHIDLRVAGLVIPSTGCQ